MKYLSHLVSLCVRVLALFQPLVAQVQPNLTPAGAFSSIQPPLFKIISSSCTQP